MRTEWLTLVQAMTLLSILIGLQILVILVLRKPVRSHFGAAAAYKLWLLPLVWLALSLLWPLLPAFPESPSAQAQLATATGAAGVSLPLPLQQLLAFDFTLPAIPGFDAARQAPAVVWQGLALVWLSGCLLLLFVLGQRLISFKRHVRDQAIPQTGLSLPALAVNAGTAGRVPVHCLPGIQSAAVYGLLKPALLVPEDFANRYDTDQRHIILSHEAVHLARRDNLWNLCASILVAVFWWNPLVHIGWRCFRLDQELSCDALALANCNDPQRKRYARTLLDSLGGSANTGIQPALSTWHNFHDIKERSLMIKTHLKTTVRPAATRVLLCMLALAGAVFTTLISESASNQVLAAEPQETLSPEVYSRIETVIQLRDAGDYEAAIAELDLLKVGFDNGQLNERETYTMWLFYASIAQAQKDYQGAISYYEQLLALEDLDPAQLEQAYYFMGGLYFVLEDYQQSLEFDRLANELQSGNNQTTNIRMASAYSRLERYEEALPHAKRVLELEGDGATRSQHTLLRTLYMQVEDYESALEQARHMVDLFNNEGDKQFLDSLESQL